MEETFFDFDLELDPFEVLGVKPQDSNETVRRRYLELVRTHTPEGDPEGFKRVKTAYDAIKTEEDRVRSALFSVPSLPMGAGPFSIHDSPVTAIRDAVALMSLMDPTSDIGRDKLNFEGLEPDSPEKSSE